MSVELQQAARMNSQELAHEFNVNEKGDTEKYILALQLWMLKASPKGRAKDLMERAIFLARESKMPASTVYARVAIRMTKTGNGLLDTSAPRNSRDYSPVTAGINGETNFDLDTGGVVSMNNGSNVSGYGGATDH